MTRITKVHRYFMKSVRCKYSLPTKRLAAIYADAAAWMEANPGYDAHLAIGRVTDHLPFKVSSIAKMEFSDSFGCWAGNDEGVTMMGFAAAYYWHADAGDLK